MAKSLYNILVGEGLNPGEVGAFLKGLERIGKKLNRSGEDHFYVMMNHILLEKKKADNADMISIEDIKNVAKEYKSFLEPNEMQLDEIMLRYPAAQEQDPTGMWNLVVGHLLEEVMENGYTFEFAISNEDVLKNTTMELSEGMIREVKNLYYQNEDINKERKKDYYISQYILAVCEYL